MAVQDDRKVMIEEGVDRAFAADGYVLVDGGRDVAKVRERIFEVLRPHKVMGPDERNAKAVTRGAMVEQVFPNLPRPDFTGERDPLLASDVWNKIDSILWGETVPNAGKPLQRLIGLNMGNGYVLCRTKVGRDQVSASYITDNVKCIEQDFIRPDNDALERKIRSIVANREMLILRQPENADRWLKGFDRHLRTIGATAREQLTLAIEATTASADEPADGEVDDES
jgi:hypothetical protein